MVDEKCIVTEHTVIGNGYRYLRFAAPTMAAKMTPGQFVHVRVPALEKSALRRPFSVFDADQWQVTVLYKTVGRGTEALNAVKEGEEIMVEGPLGMGFPTEVEGTALLVGGGFGVAPLHFLAKKLGGKAKLFVGGRTKDDILAVDRFAALGVETFVATNDGSAGEKGFVVAPLDREIAKMRERGEKFELFTCGPDGLLKAITERALELGVKGWISVDRHMICGVGACYACIQKTKAGNKRCCVDGPVFEAGELIWE